MSNDLPTNEVERDTAARDGLSGTRPPGIVRQLLHKPVAVGSMLIILTACLVALLAPHIAPYDPYEQNLQLVHQEPSREHLLGTDQLGRDVLSRVIHGSRVSLVAGVQAVVLALALGVPFGLAAGYLGGAPDTMFSRFNDAMMSIPGLVLALTVIAVLGPGLTNAMLAIGVILAPLFFRITRAATLDVRHNTFIEASVVIGCSQARVMFAHVLPNALSPILVQASLALGTAVMAEAALSFLGLGVRPPTPSWGGMLATASQQLDRSYLLWGPGICLILLVLAFTLLGDAVRDAVAGTRDRETR